MKDSFAQRVAELLPRQIIYFAAIKLIAYASSGKYGSTDVSKLSAMDALKRYGDDLLWPDLIPKKVK